MKIRDYEEMRREGYITFKEFYKYFKSYDYNTKLQTLVKMYKIYVR